MRRASFIKLSLTGLVSFFVLSLGSAYAHPGVQILTAGNSKTRTAMTQGVTYKTVGSVHLFTGKRSLIGQEPTTFTTQQESQPQIHITIKGRPFRRIRHLRTQGFYNGNGPKSRRFTQGFYSGN